MDLKFAKEMVTVITQEGIINWEITYNMSQKVDFEVNMDQSNFMLLKNQKKICLDDYYNNMYIKMKYEGRKSKEIEIPNGNYLYKHFVGNGDCVYVSESNSLFLNEDLEKNYVFFMDYDLTVQKFRNGEGVDTVELFATPDDINFVNTILKKPLKQPKDNISNVHNDQNTVFANNKIIKYAQINSEFTNDVQYGGYLYVGTNMGNCYKIKFLRNQHGQIEKETESKSYLFKKGFPISNNANPGSFRSDLDYSIHDCKRFLNQNLEIAIISGIKNQKGPDDYYYFIYIREHSIHNNNQWTQLMFNSSDKANLSPYNLFEVHFMKEDQNLIQFYTMSNAALIIFSYDKRTQTIHLDKEIYRIIIPNSCCFSETHNFFFLGCENSIEVWDEIKEIKIYTIPLDGKVIKAILTENDSHQILMVYDQKNYSEFDINTLLLRRQMPLIRIEDNSKLKLPINFDLLPGNVEFKIPYYSEQKIEIVSIREPEENDIFDYFIFDFVKCFFKHEYHENIKKYAHFYFDSIKKNMYNDDIFGPLNPLNFAMYHNDGGLLQELLEIHRYPKKITTYLSPLGLAFQLKSNSMIKTICDILIHRDYEVDFSRFDFQCLLNSEFNYSHTLISTVLNRNQLQNLPTVLSFKNDFKIYFYKDVKKPLFEIHTRE